VERRAAGGDRRSRRDRYVRHESTLPGEVRGRAEYKGIVAMYRAAFPDLDVVIEDMLSRSNMVTTRWRASGTHRAELMGISATGRRSEVTGLNLARIEDGRIVEEWQEWNEANLLRALGVLPERDSVQARAVLGLSDLRRRVGGFLSR
jgi:steroid delta-isomerase-like uncharacterized protein